MKGMWGLRGKITVMVTVLLLASVLTIGGIVYYQSRALVIRSLGTQALQIVERAQELIDPEQYKDMLATGDSHPYYTELRDKLNDLREKAGLKYLYTMDKHGDTYYYRVDAMPWGDEDACHFGKPEKVNNLSKNWDKALQGGKVAGDLQKNEWGRLLSAYAPVTDANGEVLGFLGGDFSADEVYIFLQKSLLIIIITLLVILIAGVGFGYLFARNIAKPLERLVEKSEQVRDGDLSVEIENIERGDEVGRLYLAFGEMVQNLRNLVAAIQDRYAKLVDGVEVLKESAGSAEHSMQVISSSVHDVARGSEHQVDDLGKAVVEMTTVAGHIDRIENNSHQVRELSEEAEERAVAGRVVLQTTREQIGTIDRQAQDSAEIIRELGVKIGEVTNFITVISNIAEQTNLLALNAAIESARAGEEGRGFAVVAKEIRSLAEESAAVAQKVAGMIKEIHGQSMSAVKAIELTVKEVQSGVGAIKNADEKFEGVLAANQSVSQNIADVAEAIRSISSVFKQLEAGMNGVSAVSEEASATAEQVATLVGREQTNIQRIKDESKSLVQLAEDLQREIKRFRL